jgi:hypothetical protein
VSDIKLHPLKFFLIDYLGYTIQELVKEMEDKTGFEITIEQLIRYLNGEDTFPWRIEWFLNVRELCSNEGWDKLKCEEDEVADRLIRIRVHILEDKRKTIEANQRIRDCCEDYESIMRVE